MAIQRMSAKRHADSDLIFHGLMVQVGGHRRIFRFADRSCGVAAQGTRQPNTALAPAHLRLMVLLGGAPAETASGISGAQEHHNDGAVLASWELWGPPRIRSLGDVSSRIFTHWVTQCGFRHPHGGPESAPNC
jgi:hypothetical protein